MTDVPHVKQPASTLINCQQLLFHCFSWVTY